MALQAVIDLLYSCFEYVYRFYSEMFMITDTVSAWDFLLVCFVVGGLAALIARSFGANSIGQGGSAVRGAISPRNNKKR